MGIKKREFWQGFQIFLSFLFFGPILALQRAIERFFCQKMAILAKI